MMTLRDFIDRNCTDQADFAARAKVPASQVSLWLKGERGEKGGRRPGLGNATKIAKATNGAVPVSHWVRRGRIVARSRSAARDLPNRFGQ